MYFLLTNGGDDLVAVVSDSCDPMDCSPPGSSVHGILQARVVEWGAIAFSNWKLEVDIK